MMKLRRCRNDSIAVPINRLPPELLRIILGHVRHPPSTRYTSHLSASRFASYHPIVSTMLVCHKWHAIGSQAASLWTDIDFACQGAFAPVLLTRSLGAPIRLCGRLDGDNTLQKVITDHGERIRELDLWVGAGFSHPMPVLQSILAVDMPRVRVLSLSRKSSSVGEGPASVITDADTPASFPTLKAMLLQGFLLVPTHVLPQLTHLNLTRLDDVNPSSILKLLKNTPALEVLDVIQCREYTAPPNSAAPSSSVILLRLHSVYMWCLTSATVHDLMARLEAPSLASLRLSSIFAMSGALLSTPLIPRSLSTRTVNRLAFDLGGNFTSFHTVFHGNDLSLAMGINAIGVQDIERASWAFDDFPTILPLCCVEELHFQAQEWDVADDLLPHLAARMPMVSTLFVKHNERTSRDEDSDTDGLMDPRAGRRRPPRERRPGAVPAPRARRTYRRRHPPGILRAPRARARTARPGRPASAEIAHLAGRRARVPLDDEVDAPGRAGLQGDGHIRTR